MSANNGVRATPRKVIQANYRTRQANRTSQEREIVAVAREIVMFVRQTQGFGVNVELDKIEGDELMILREFLVRLREASLFEMSYIGDWVGCDCDPFDENQHCEMCANVDLLDESPYP